MAARDGVQWFYSDSDSDDEFFDALANENKADGVQESDNTNQNCDGTSRDRTDNIKGAGDASITHEKLNELEDEKTEHELFSKVDSSQDVDTQRVEDSEEKGGVSDESKSKLEETETIQCDSGRSSDDYRTSQSAESVMQPSSVDMPQADEQCSGEDANIHEGLRAEENEEEAQDEVKGSGQEDEEVEGEIDEEQVRREREDAMTEEEREVTQACIFSYWRIQSTLPKSNLLGLKK